MDLMALIQQALEASGKLRDLSKKVEDADFKTRRVRIVVV